MQTAQRSVMRIGDQPQPGLGEMPYTVEVGDGEQAVIAARTRTPGIAFAAYYAAQREYVDRGVKLWREDRVLTSTAPRLS